MLKLQTVWIFTTLETNQVYSSKQYINIFVCRFIFFISIFLVNSFASSLIQCHFFVFFLLGCEYGDRIIGCSAKFCPSNPPSTCCGTCYSGATLTMPSQEPTTTDYKNPCKTALTTTVLMPSSSTSTRTQQTTTSLSSFFLFRLTITLIINISDDLSNNILKEGVISKVQTAVCCFNTLILISFVLVYTWLI